MSREGGAWVPVQPIGWREEHTRFQRFLLWVLGREHCNDREGQRSYPLRD